MWRVIEIQEEEIKRLREEIEKLKLTHFEIMTLIKGVSWKENG